MTTSRRAAATVLLAAVSLAGCGGASRPSGQPVGPLTVSSPAAPQTSTAAQAGGRPVEAVEMLTAAVHKVSGAGSARVDGTISTKAAGAVVNLHLAGVERWKPSLAARLTLSGLAVSGQNVGAIKMIMTPSALYMSMPLLTQQTHKTWAELSFAELSKASGVNLGQYTQQAQQLEPGQYLAMLTKSGNVALVGHETIDGVATQHYAGTVDVSKAVAAMSAQARAIWAKLATAGATEHVDVWLDAAGQPRRIKVDLTSSGLSTAITLHISQYGTKVDVTAPPAAQTVDLAKLGALSRG